MYEEKEEKEKIHRRALPFHVFSRCRKRYLGDEYKYLFRPRKERRNITKQIVEKKIKRIER